MSNPNRPDPNRTHTEAVAEAMREFAHTSCVHPRDVRYFDRLAEVAIEAYTAALGGLTEELRYPTSWTYPHPGPDRRLVTPWVAVPDSGGEQ